MLSTTRAPHRRMSLAVMVALAVFASMLTGVSQAQIEDTDIIVINDGMPSNEQITTRLSRLTVASARTAIVASSDNRSYADSLASAGLQDLGPLLLLDDIPAGGDLSNAVATELLRLEVSRVLILGGEAAVSLSTQDAIERAGYEVQRIAGPSRVETAIEVARVGAPAAETALLVRAFGSNEVADPTQGWVDALSSGPLAIENGAPILLSQQDSLSAATAAYLEESSITDIVIIGGTAAVSATVETQLLGLGYAVFRIAGSDRVQTALSVNDVRGVLDQPSRSVIVDGFADNGWVGGFASARHAAETRAAILPAQGDELPPGVRAVIAANPVYEARPVTCIVPIAACQEVNPDLRPDEEPVDTPTETPTVEPTAEPNTQAVFLDTFPAAGTVVEPNLALNTELLDLQAREFCETVEDIDPLDEDVFEACVEEFIEEALADVNIGVDYDVPPLDAIRVTLDDPLRELQNAVSISGLCIIDKEVAMPESDVVVGVEDTRPPEYLGFQNGPPIEGPPDDRNDETILAADPSGLCLIDVTSPLTANLETSDESDDEFFTETVGFLYDSYLANFRVASVPNAPQGEVSFQDDSWGYDNSYEWTFGDGNTSTEQNPTHTYDAGGEYEVMLTITAASESAPGVPNQTSITRIVEVQ